MIKYLVLVFLFVFDALAQGIGEPANRVVSRDILRFDLDKDGNAEVELEYLRKVNSLGDLSVYSIYAYGLEGGLFYVSSGSELQTNEISSRVRPDTLAEPQEIGVGRPGWRTNLFLWGAGDSVSQGLSFSSVLASGKALVFGFTSIRPTGKHFGWARVQSTNSLAFGFEFRNFNTNNPPVFSEVTINPVPYAAIPIGRPSPGGPKLTFTRQPADKLRLSYPDWGKRYVIRRRSLPKGLVTKVYPGGRNGLVATNGVYSLDVTLEDAQGFFELYLPPENVAP